MEQVQTAVAPTLAERPDHVPADRVLDFNLHRPVPAGQTVHEFWREAIANAPHDVMWSPHSGGHWIVMDPDLCEAVLTDPERFSSRIVIVPREPAGEAYSKYIPLSLDPPRHGPFRKLLNEGLSPKMIGQRKEAMRGLTVDLIEGFRTRGRCNFTHDFAEQLPVHIFLRLVDLPASDAGKLKHLADQFTRPDGSLTFDEVEQQFSDYIRPIIVDRRGGAGEDLITLLASGQAQGRALSDDEAENLATQALVGGLDTVVNLLGFVFSHLAQDTATRRVLSESPEQIDDAVLEFLRRFPVVSDSREVVSECSLDGVTLKPRDMIMASTVVMALSDRANPEPLEFRLGRQGRRHFVFGKGHHMCPGAHLARTELKMVLEEWLARIPDFRLAGGIAPTYTSGIVATVNPFELEWDV